MSSNTPPNEVRSDEDTSVDLESLGDSIASVLVDEADSLAVHAFIDGRNQLDRTLWDRATELGWLTIGLPERFGGLGLGARGLTVLSTKLGAHAAPGSFLSTLCAAQALAEADCGPEIDEYLNHVAAGRCRIAVPAQLEDSESESKRERLFLGDVDSELFLAPLNDGDWAMVRPQPAAIKRLDMWDRTRSILRVHLDQFETVVPITNGALLEKRLQLHMALALAADSLGGADALLNKTIGYMKERRQFDRAIASFQALKHRVADMKTMIVAGTPAIEQALASVSDNSPDALLWASLAKAKLTEDYAFISQDCLQLHGGVGFTWEFDVHIFLKRARLNEMLFAPGWIMRDRAAEALAMAVAEERSALELSLI